MLKNSNTPRKTDQMSVFNDKIPKISNRFIFERALKVVGRADDVEDDVQDVDLHNGTLILSNSYARIARHVPTGTICVIMGKTSVDLCGQRDEKTGAILATQEGLSKSYIGCAYRSSGEDKDFYQVRPRIQRSIRRFNEDLGERASKHFTLYGASFDGVEVYTNGRLAYLLEKESDTGQYKLSLFAPSRRKNGNFVPVEIKPDGLRRMFLNVSTVIAKTGSYAEVRDKLARHWQVMSSKLWDEKDMYQGEGYEINAKKWLARLQNHIEEHGTKVTLVTVSVGLMMGVLNPAYTVVGGIAGAFVHTAAHLLFDEGYHTSQEVIKRVREARKRLNIEAYPFEHDVSDHFKIQTSDNIKKLAAKIDLKRFKAKEFEFLTTDQARMLLDHEEPVDGFRPNSLRAYLLTVHQRGFSSKCVLPDNNSRLDVFQSGLVRFIHEKQDGRILLYARYRPDACVLESQRLPEDKRKKLGNGIVCFEYDRLRGGFYHGFRRIRHQGADISHEQLMHEVEELLFRDNFDKDTKVKEQSLKAIADSFAPMQDGDPGVYLRGNSQTLPALKAIL